MIPPDHPSVSTVDSHALLGDTPRGTAAGITLPDRLERITAMGMRVVAA
ncbi:MAG TPA: hypothetical protein VF238_10305 [Methylomirabilota bacterium]